MILRHPGISPTNDLVAKKIFTFLDLVRQHVLTSEFASEQLGMSVAEFEALL